MGILKLKRAQAFKRNSDRDYVQLIPFIVKAMYNVAMCTYKGFFITGGSMLTGCCDHIVLTGLT